MAKFLPFVVEKSTPIHIYQTLIARSKGMNSVLVASILYLVLEKGIIAVREAASELPDMDLTKLYEQLINAYPSYRITTEQFTKMQLMCKYVYPHRTEGISSELKEYEIEDTMSFLLVMLLIGKVSEYTQFSFEGLFNGESDHVENDLISKDLFSSNGEEFMFESKRDLAAYIWFHSFVLIDDSGVEPVKAVYLQDENNRGSSKTKFDASPQPDKAPAWDKSRYGDSPIPPYRSKQANGTPSEAGRYDNGIPFPEER